MGVGVGVSTGLLHVAHRGCYCFERVSRAALAAVAMVNRCRIKSKRRARASTCVALAATRMTHQLAHCAKRRQSRAPGLQPILLAFDGVPGEEDEDEPDKFQAGSQAEVDEAERGDVVLPARAVHAAVLLPQHARRVNHSTEVDGGRYVGCNKIITIIHLILLFKTHLYLLFHA